MMLPSDRYLAEILGLTEEQYRHFQIEVRKRAAEGPQPAVVAGTLEIIAIAQIVIGLGMLAASALLKPSVPQSGQAPGQPRQRQETTDPIIRNDRFAPRYGFDSQQDIATLGSIIPIVYANRELISGNYYGGIRINMPMLWNQILSLGGGQMLRGVFLLGEGPVASIDATNFGIGSNTLNGYTFESSSATEEAARATVYFSADGGRIAGADRVAGRTNANDDGSSSGGDVFQVYWDGGERSDFCASSKPSTQTAFGVYSPIGNNFAYKINPVIRPGVRTVFQNKSGDTRINVSCPVDSQQMNQRDKYRAGFTTFSGIIGDGTEQSVSVGDTITYKLFDDSDWLTTFNKYQDQAGSAANCKDVASAVASRQHTWDDSLIVGELYKIGSALAVCTSRTSDIFLSEADLEGSAGTTVTATFSVVAPGAVKGYTEVIIKNSGRVLTLNTLVGGTGYVTGTYTDVPLTGGSGTGATADIVVNVSGVVSSVTIVNRGNGYAASDSLSAAAANLGGTGSGFSINVATIQDGGDAGQREVATTGGHIFRYVSAYIATSRPCQAVELGLKSTLGGRINNLCNFRDAKTYQFADESYCESFENEEADEIVNVFYQSGTISVPLQRYSFFKIKYREIDDSTWTVLTHAYGVRSETQQALFNYIRVEFTDNKQREFMLEPLTGFEVRNSKYGAGATLYVLDAKKGRVTVSENGANAVFNGESVALSTANFGTSYGSADPALDDDYSYKEGGGSPNRDYKGLPLVDTTTYIDDYAKLAETFVYSEITTTAEGGPEHEIVYVNEIVPNATTPLYDDLALVGINIRSSAEFQQFAQFSSYVTGGKECTRMLGGSGATHLFPDVLYDLMTNTRYGAGSFIKPYMIDTTEFAAAAQWCLDRRYFYDAAVAEPINIRQWAADLAATHLLQFGEIDGKYFLRPAISFTAVPISGLFTAGNIAENSFQLQYFDPEDRDPIKVSVRYREERPSTDPTSPGLFPVVREVLVREVIGDDFLLTQILSTQNGDTLITQSGDTFLVSVVEEFSVVEESETYPIEQLDMSTYCTSREHAIDAAKFLVRMRRIPTHTITFKTTHDGLTAGLAPGDYIKVAMDETEYDEFNNGVVTPEGALVSTKTLANGIYDVIAWDGTEGTPPADATLTVSNSGKTASPTGIVFTVKLPSTQVRVYQIERITPDDDGAFTIEAMHMPVNSSGILKVADGFDTAGNWTISG